ncbi:hypothetical protein HN51_020071 [Arachis hypogaea]|nr:uncharacterized protein DS421_8g245780 [Arachis hypogaea]
MLTAKEGCSSGVRTPTMSSTTAENINVTSMDMGLAELLRLAAQPGYAPPKTDTGGERGCYTHLISQTKKDKGQLDSKVCGLLDVIVLNSPRHDDDVIIDGFLSTPWPRAQSTTVSLPNHNSCCPHRREHGSCPFVQVIAMVCT